MKLEKNALDGPNKQLLLKYQFSRAEAAIIYFLVNGFTTQGIVDESGVSVQGIKDHKWHIYRKLDVHSKRAAVTKLLNEGFVVAREEKKENSNILTGVSL